MSRRLLLPALLAASACSRSAQPPDVSIAPVTDRVVTAGGGTLTLGRSSETVGISGDVSAPPDTVFRALLAVYAELGVKTTAVSSVQRAVGNQHLTIRRRLGGAPLQSYLECGGNPGEPNAETFDIVMNLMTFVTVSTSGGSTVTTRIQALGSDPKHGQGNQLRCSTTGELELRIVKMVRARLSLR